MALLSATGLWHAAAIYLVRQFRIAPEERAAVGKRDLADQKRSYGMLDRPPISKTASDGRRRRLIGEEQVPVGELAPGLYLVQLCGDGHMAAVQMLKM